MSVLKTLRDTVAPELNHLYNTPPVETPEGLDFGWHGREHALHAFFVARMFGAEADIRSGDLALLSPYVPPITTLERTPKHTWCSVNGVAPVDLSLTLAYFQAPQLRGAIIGDGRDGDWNVHYAEDESVLDESFPHTNEILYIEREIHAFTAAELLENPFLLLPPENPDDPARWTARYGPGIHAKITLHCHACATRAAKSVRNRFAREEALAWIAEQYAMPEPAIRKALAATGEG